MGMKLKIAAATLLVGLSNSLPAIASTQTIIECGASTGLNFAFNDGVYIKDGNQWADDSIRNGKIILVQNGDEFDILFDDAAGSYGYREDGANVIINGINSGLITVTAVNKKYLATYTFDTSEKQVLWTTHKWGARINKVAIFHADCK